MKKYRGVLLLSAFLVLSLAACQNIVNNEAPIATLTATEAPTATNTPTPEPTEIVEPTATAVPVNTGTPTPAPTATVVPTATSTPVPTATVTVAPTATSIPTPSPTATVAPTATGTPTPRPTSTPTPKPTKKPTNTPTPTPKLRPNPTNPSVKSVYYRTPEVTAVKDQGSFNICWAFAGISAIETELIRNNGASMDLDLSELQLTYFYHNQPMDPLGQCNVLFTEGNNFDSGGGIIDMAGYFATGTSPLEETELPYTLDNVPHDMHLEESLAYNNRYYLKECRLLVEPSVEEVKEAILKYGSVVISYEADTLFYNFQTYGWYNPNRTGLYMNSHAVCIVGWDDEYSKNNFNNTPAGDGAWIVKNSWNTDWGMDGYFYLSYYDEPLKDSPFILVDMEPGTYADNIYQNVFSSSDGKVTYSFPNEPGREDETFYGNRIAEEEGITKLANVFIAHANNSGAEELKAVSVFTHKPGNYEIKVYKNLSKNSNPEGGTLAATLTGSLEYSGFLILPLNKAIYLSEGEMFSIVATLTDENGNHIGVDDGNQKYTASTKGQSFVYEDGKWIDTVGYYGYNFAIRAYTNDISNDKTQDDKKVTAELVVPSSDNYRFDKVYTDPVEDVELIHADISSVMLSWKETSDKHYVVYIYNPVSGVWYKHGYTTNNHYTVTGLNPGTKYTIGIAGVSQEWYGMSPWVPYYEGTEYATIEITTQKGISLYPKATIKQNGCVISWSEVFGATKYDIYVMSPATDFEWEYLDSLNAGSSLSFNHTDLVPGMKYSYRVYVYNGKELLGKSSPAHVIFE